jgi:hypothetical protein
VLRGIHPEQVGRANDAGHRVGRELQLAGVERVDDRLDRTPVEPCSVANPHLVAALPALGEARGEQPVEVRRQSDEHGPVRGYRALADEQADVDELVLLPRALHRLAAAGGIQHDARRHDGGNERSM